MRALSFALLTVCLIGLAACNRQAHDDAGESTDFPDENTLAITGEIRHISLEGGAWIIQAVDSTRYQPLNLSEQYHKDGLKVRVVAEKQPERMGFLQIGPIIEIKSIEER